VKLQLQQHEIKFFFRWSVCSGMGWSVYPGIGWSITTGMGGQFTPEWGGQFGWIFQIN